MIKLSGNIERFAVLKIVAVYVLFSGLWIFFFDTLLQRIVPNHDLMVRLSTCSDLLFIILTSILLYKLFFRNIMQIAASNRQLLANEERFHAIYNNIYEAVFVHDALTGKIVDVNQAICSMYGYSRDEAIGLEIDDICQGAPPCSSTEILDRLVLAVQGTPQVFECIANKRDGSIFWAEMSMCKATIGGEERVIVLVRNISKRKEFEDELSLTRFTVDNVADAVYWITKDQRLWNVNDAACKMLGYTREELLSMSIAEIDPACAPDKSEELKRVGSLHFASTHKTRDGSVIPVEVTANYFKYNDIEYICLIVRDITRRQQVEEALLKSNQRLDMLAESASMLFKSDSPQEVVDSLCRKVLAFLDCQAFFNYLVDHEKKLLHLNACAGIPDEDIRKMEWLDYGVGLCGCSARDGTRLVVENLQDTDDQYTALVRPFGIQAYACHPLISRGRVLGTLSFCSRTKHHFTDDELSLMKTVADQVAIAIDRELTELALHGSENTLIKLMDLLPVGVVCADANDDIEYVNQSFVEQFGYALSDIPTVREWLSLAYPDSARRDTLAEDWRGVIREARSKASHVSPLETKITCKDGTVKQVLINTQVAPNRTLAIFTDITEHEYIQNEIIKVQKLESLGLLASGIAHDFNNILTGILGYISFARMCVDSSHKSFKALGEAEKASRRAAQLAHQLLTFAKGGEPVKKRVSIPHLVHESVSLALRGSKVQEAVEFADSLHDIEADEGQLNQALNNIIINAVQSMPAGGTLSIKAANVTLDSTNIMGLTPGEYVRLTVADEGCGIGEEEQNKIFDPFFTTRPGGTGLGLTTAYSIISKHGGYINVHSVVGKGSTFTLYLPSTGAAFPELESNREPLAAATLSGTSVLVMDDEEIIRNLAMELLGHLGYRVVTCISGEEAIDLYKAAMGSGTPFFAVIMDLTIPGGMGGKEAAQQILAIDPDARLIVSSGYSSDPVMAEYKNHGFSGAVEKPYNIDEIAWVLDSLQLPA
jgi:PAS domain S-box-containing protein